MNSLLRSLAIVFAFTLSGIASADEPREVLWEDLMPEGWVPEEPMYSQSSFLDESGPAAVQMSLDAPVA